MIEIGDIYLVRIYFSGQAGNYKVRPVLILNINDDIGICTIVEITSVPPKELPCHFSQLKEEIHYWQECGLYQRSFIKCNNIHNIEIKRLYRKIGKMNENEFLRIVETIDNYIT